MSSRSDDPVDSAARLAEIRRHHGDDRPCSMKNDECFLLAEVDRLQARVAELEHERSRPYGY